MRQKRVGTAACAGSLLFTNIQLLLENLIIPRITEEETETSQMKIGNEIGKYRGGFRENITISHIMDHKDRIRISNDVTCFHPMDNKY